MRDGLEPLPNDLQAALEGLRPPSEASEVREALLSKLHASVGAEVVTGAPVAKAGLSVPWWVAGSRWWRGSVVAWRSID
jgi:hypothetical protein